MRFFFKLLCKDILVLANLARRGYGQSRFKQLFVGLFAAAMLAGLWRFFLNGFRFLAGLGGVGTLIIQQLFALFFFSLGAMLLISSVITAFAVIFRADENPLLILSPVRHGERILHQWIEVTAICAWAFFFMIVPFVGAFVVHERLPLLFLFWTGMLSIPFVFLCCGAGMLLTMAAVRWLPRFRPVMFAFLMLALTGLWWWRSSAVTPARSDDAVLMLARLVPGLRMAAFPLWPSRWVAEGITALGRGDWQRGGWLAAVLVSNLLMAGWLISLAAEAWFYPAWQKTLTPLRRPVRRPAVFRFQSPAGGLVRPAFLKFLPRDCHALALKDMRLLMRDPVQWTQGAVFFGLLAIYFFNLRNLNYHLLDPVWRNLIAFINVFSLGAIMCSFCSRFIYPQMSLEGHACWILGLSPVGMGRVLMVKYLAALAGLGVVSAALLALSSNMLEADLATRHATLLISLALPAALCALAMGLGALYMDLKQSNPAIIISGFGGTLNLALSLAYLIGAVVPFAVLYHWHYQARLSALMLRRAMPWAALWLAVLTAATAAIPLALGRRALLRREY